VNLAIFSPLFSAISTIVTFFVIEDFVILLSSDRDALNEFNEKKLDLMDLEWYLLQRNG